MNPSISALIDTSRFKRSGRYWAGPCCMPDCAPGNDRFVIKDDEKWCCRYCTEGRWEDAITLLRRLKGYSYADACRLLDVAPRVGSGPTLPPRAPRAEPKEVEVPSQGHRSYWARYVEESRRRLWGSPNMLNWLRARGLNDDTIRRAWIGYDPHSEYRCLTIPWIFGMPDHNGPSGLYGVRKRFGSDAPQKYGACVGSRPVLFVGKPHDGGDCIVTEGEWDALLVGQEAHGQCGAVTLGSASAVIYAQAVRYLRGARRLFLMTEDDEPAAKFARRFMDLFPDAVRIPVMFGKDPTEFHQTSGASLANQITILLRGPDSLETEAIRLFPGARVVDFVSNP